jgi:argininosuccinate lyase
MKLWEKGITIDDKIEQFTVGNDRTIDLTIAKYDLQASAAHAKMLAKVGLINTDELNSLIQGLGKLTQQLSEGTLVITDEFEDIHSKIEHELILHCGEAGKKIHTARSRNDQVLVALHLYYKEHLSLLQEQAQTLFDTLLTLAEQFKDHPLPGYTHLQVAMPSSFGLWFSAYAEILIDDLILLEACKKIIDQNPLGSAAGYGSSFPIDRNFTTDELQFATLKYNVVAAQLGRGKNERTLALVLGSMANTLARFAMDICLYTSQNFGFISFPDKLTTGSSIMPHKKNPDVFELIRGKCNKIQAQYSETLLITNNLPSGYHRDFQLLKENSFKAIDDLHSVLEIFNYSIQHIHVKTTDLKKEPYQHLYTVDSINTLVANGISFREAYQRIGAQVTNDTYSPDLTKKHQHIGSKDNLCLPAIRDKMKQLTT